jgi:hypothetical protein
MDDRAVTQLVDTLNEPSVQSLVLVPAESPASVHVRRNGRHGWVVELDCRNVLSHDLEAVVTEGSAHAEPGTCDVDVHSDAQVHVTIRARERGVLQRVLQVLVSEHRRSRPQTRLAAIVLDDLAPAPRRIDVVLPPRPQACRSASLWGASARSSLPRVPTPV